MHWDYFLILEKDLIEISETLELSKSNYRAFGPRIVQLILSAGSELDSALKNLTQELDSECETQKHKQLNMKDYKNAISEHLCEQFATAGVRFLRSDIILKPWEQIGIIPDPKLEWWSAYTGIKHNRFENYKNANLETALNLIAALFIADAYLSEVLIDHPSGMPQAIDWDYHKYAPQLEDYYKKNADT